MAYEVIIDGINNKDWEQHASCFADYSIYQTWGYQQIRAQMDHQQLSRMVIVDENKNVVSMCQLRIKCARQVGLRIGYARWGPLMRRKDGLLIPSSEIFDLFRKAYLGPKVNVLRIVPNVIDDEAGRAVSGVIENSGFYRVKSYRPYHTMFLPLDCSEEQLSKGLHQSWRRQLRKAQKADLETIESNGKESLDTLTKLCLETLRRKRIKGLDPQEFTRTQSMLSPAEKMKTILVNKNGRSVTAHLTSNLGDSAVFLLGGSSEDGLACRASYLAWWNAITLSNRLGMKMYDVGGIDFEKNPTVSRFKAGIGANEILYIGAFEACTNGVVKKMWQVIEKAHSLITG